MSNSISRESYFPQITSFKHFLPTEDENTQQLEETTGFGDYHTFNPCIHPSNSYSSFLYTEPESSMSTVSMNMAAKQRSTASAKIGVINTANNRTKTARLNLNVKGSLSSLNNNKSLINNAPILKSKLLDHSKTNTNFKKATQRVLVPASASTTVETVDCRLKLCQTKEELKKLESHLQSVESNSLDKQQKLKSKLEMLEAELGELLEDKQNQKQSWLNSLAEIEEKGNLTREKLQKSLEENKKLRYENAIIKSEQKLLRKQVETLQLKTIESKSARKKYRTILKEFEDRENSMKKQLGQLSYIKELLLQDIVPEESSSTTLALVKTNKTETNFLEDGSGTIDSNFMSTTEKVRQLLQRQSKVSFAAGSAPSSQTIVTIQSTSSVPSSQHQKKGNATKVIAYQGNSNSNKYGDDSSDAILRELFFLF